MYTHHKEMELLKLVLIINIIIIYISLLITVISFIAIFYLLYKGYRTGIRIKEITYELGKELDNEKVLDYINFIDGIEIPDRKVYWNTLKAGYRLIEMNSNIDNELKKQLKIVMLGKGVLI